jgi:hypothetical protein
MIVSMIVICAGALGNGAVSDNATGAENPHSHDNADGGVLILKAHLSPYEGEVAAHLLQEFSNVMHQCVLKLALAMLLREAQEVQIIVVLDGKKGPLRLYGR